MPNECLLTRLLMPLLMLVLVLVLVPMLLLVPMPVLVAGEQRPVFLTVEPSKADCVLRFGRAGKLCKVPGDLDTIQNGLGCAEVPIHSQQP